MQYNYKSPKIYIISGKAKSGKDKMADMIIEKNKDKKCIKLSYAYYLKQYVKKITGWDGLEETKPRKILQDFGIDFLKNKIDKYFLINRVLEDVEIYSYFYDLIIITDARLIEEIEIPKQKLKNITVIRIKGDHNNLSIEEKNHITETNLDDYKNFDYVIDNNNLEEELNKILELERVCYEK